jgi:hypothetical protein
MPGAASNLFFIVTLPICIGVNNTLLFFFTVGVLSLAFICVYAAACAGLMPIFMPQLAPGLC